MSKPTELPAWDKLQSHHNEIKEHHLRDLFDQDPDRWSRFHLRFNDFLFDYSKNRITEETISLLLDLAEEANLKSWIDDLFSAEKINHTEKRAAFHMALRNLSGNPMKVEGTDVIPEVKRVLFNMKGFAESIRNGGWRGYTDKAITDVVNIGIGGSDLGPAMVVKALEPYTAPNLRFHFISNVDASQLVSLLSKLDHQTTLFIVTSKTFTTQETLANARSIRTWFLDQAKDKSAIAKHFAAVSTNTNAVIEFGINPRQMFEFWDWVGGRYSVWSAVGLSIMIAIGYENFEKLLNGAHEMDEHFRSADFAVNMPVILALIGIWHNNFFNAKTYAILPYDQRLEAFPAYLQQLEMESNGKHIDREGSPIDYATCPILWGATGTNGQHAFFQLMHQGTQLIPSDFLIAAEPDHPLTQHHDLLISNFLAQTEALMRGKTGEEAHTELLNQGYLGEKLERLAPYKTFKGNQPSNSIVFKKLDPKTLGSLIALYEHKVFVQSVIWNINPFDQWGVELGKTLANKIYPELNSQANIDNHDSSTNGLINYFNSQH